MWQQEMNRCPADRIRASLTRGTVEADNHVRRPAVPTINAAVMKTSRGLGPTRAGTESQFLVSR